MAEGRFVSTPCVITHARSKQTPKETLENYCRHRVGYVGDGVGLLVGLAQVIFGFYEAPSVIDAVNGFVVWNDRQFIDRVGELIEDRELTRRMGGAGAQLAKDLWDWDRVAPLWEQAVCQAL